MGESGLDGAKGEPGEDGSCMPDDVPNCNCDSHTLVIHSQTDGVRFFDAPLTK